ncbi:MAG TPA: Imm39 family immunity protein [Thermoanaerobaculia bacterium]
MRSILIGAVSTAPARLKTKDSGQVMVEICDELDAPVRSCLAEAPFSVISIVLRYVDGPERAIELGKINRHRELEVGIDVDVRRIRRVDRNTLKDIFRERVMRSLQLVKEKFGLPCILPSSADA